MFKNELYNPMHICIVYVHRRIDDDPLDSDWFVFKSIRISSNFYTRLLL